MPELQARSRISWGAGSPKQGPAGRWLRSRLEELRSSREPKGEAYLTKLCMFLFLAALFSGRTNELGVLIGALPGTVLLWPLYRAFVPAPKRRG